MKIRGPLVGEGDSSGARSGGRDASGVSAIAACDPNRIAIVAQGRELTYGELDERARRLGSVLSELGAREDRPVACVLRNGFEPFEVATAASMIKAPYLPVNWHLKANELSYMLNDARVGAVVTHADLSNTVESALDSLDGVPPPLLVGDGYEEAISRAGVDPGMDSGPGPELVFYTSGTTARPKGVVHGGLGNVDARRAGMEGQRLLWNWQPDDVYVMSGPSYHASHAGWGLTSLYVGAKMVIPSRFDAIEFLECVSAQGGTRSFMVPAHFIRILEIPRRRREGIDLSTFKLIVHGGAPCPIAVKRRMIEEFPCVEIFELYGASEGGATRISPSEWLERPGSVGLPWPGVEIRILDSNGNAVAPGEDGVVWIRPPSAQRFTYRNDPEATKNAWRDGAFSVGDIGRLDDDGYLTITDRVSDMVLWGGVNIAPREIEETLYDHPSVVDCAVFGVHDERDGEHLKAIVEIRDSTPVSDLADHVRGRLADYKVPKEWEVVEELPRDPNGKVLKRLLK
ncbi:MAG: AMP-binding protein [Actinobacteria bacterium]|nr:AMP-binding protein [Actinomycetota bacterium]